MTNYEAGRRFEWMVRDHLGENGYDLIRSAGSKSKVDLIALKPGEILFVQCKRRDGYVLPSERAELLRLARLALAVPLVAYRPARKPIHYRRLLGGHPKEWESWTPDELMGET